MFKFFQRKTTIILLVAIFLVFIEAFVSITSADFIQALTLRASNNNNLEQSFINSITEEPAIKEALEKARAGISFNIIGIYDLGTLNISLIFSFLILFAFICGVIGIFFSSRAVSMYVANMRYETYKKIQTFSFQDIDKFSVPSLITRNTTDAELVNISFSFAIKFLPNGIFTLIFGLLKSVIEFKQYSIVYAILLPFMFLFLIVIIWRSIPYFKESQINTDEINKKVRETILGIRVIKAYNLEKSEKSKFDVSNLKLANSSEKAFSRTGILMPIIQSAVSITLIVILIIGYNNANGHENGEIQFAKVIGFTSILMQVLFSFIITIATFVQVSRSIPSIKRILEVNNFKPSLKFIDKSNNKIEHGLVEFQNVTYSFTNNPENSVLKNINLKIKPREIIGIIGGTGSGKSTLINLLARLMDPTKGKVLIDGIDVKEYAFNELNKKISIAMQTATLFSGTIKSNIAMGLPIGLSEEELIKEVTAAAKASEAWEFILKKENNINHVVEQRGKNFSGGQKQRISIARTIAKKSKIIIFDDSTSALDTVTEKKVQNNIKEYNDSTTIIVAQRISSVENLDRIVVMDKGEIVGFDTHWNLLASNKIYRSIAASQIGTEELNELLIERGVRPIEK